MNNKDALNACYQIMNEIPALWGDHCVDGWVNIRLSADTILLLEEIIARAKVKKIREERK